MIQNIRLSRCYVCGGEVKLIAKPAGFDFSRWRGILKDVMMPIPSGFAIPTCIKCGETSMIPEVSEELDKLLLDKLKAIVNALP